MENQQASSALETVDAINTLAEKIYNATTRSSRIPLFEQADFLINQLKGEARKLSGESYIIEVLNKLHQDIAVLTGKKRDLGHGRHQYYLWALGDITRLKSKLCFDRPIDKTEPA